MAIEINRRAGYVEAVVPGDEQQARVFWYHRNNGFGLKFKCGDAWYSQWLMWSCRAGQRSYYRPMVALYKALRRAGIVEPGTLKRLAH